MITISVDLMGGDNAPLEVLNGIVTFAKSNANVKFALFGKITDKEREVLTQNNINFTYFEADDNVSSDDKPAHALRKKQNSSMALAIQAVRDGTANACVSAGNTGVLMAMSKIYLGLLENVDRPALCTSVPTKENCSVMLDMGANVDCDPENFYQFAIMGQAFIRSVYEISNPSVAILNIGEEDEKGNALVKTSYKLLKEKLSQEEFSGFIEGDSIALGKVNVIVTDGFTGNIALKTFEGSGKLMTYFLKKHFKSSILAKIGYILAKSALSSLFEKIDPNNYNGALLLGLKGISVKSHGGANAKGFANAIKVAYNLAKNDAISDIRKKLRTR